MFVLYCLSALLVTFGPVELIDPRINKVGSCTYVHAAGTCLYQQQEKKIAKRDSIKITTCHVFYLRSIINRTTQEYFGPVNVLWEISMQVDLGQEEYKRDFRISEQKKRSWQKKPLCNTYYLNAAGAKRPMLKFHARPGRTFSRSSSRRIPRVDAFRRPMQKSG